MRKLPPLRALQVFEAAARLQHFSQAGAELCISQSAVSHQVRLLEQYFGTHLFDRSRRQLTLTAKGAQLAKGLELEFNELSNLCQQAQGVPSQDLTLVVYSSFAVKWLIPRLGDFKRHHPEVKLRLEMVSQDPELVGLDCDILITGQKVPRGFHQECLLQERLIPVCSPSYAEQHSPMELANFQQYMLLIVDEGPLGLDWPRWCERNQIDFDQGATHQVVSHVLLAIEAAIAGLGITLASDFMVEQDIEQGRLVALPWPDIHTGFEFLFSCHRQRLAEPGIVKVRSWLQGQLAQN
ncbi:LysR family transcriptional regulator [Shewanella sp. D64]|uniref:LysR substrate-binding domain-containing protein n=1 Tax=unclassified Shewanella TaxID=196818 RepID=UPI0022BA3D9E|nr:MULTISPECIES: LysR substrate-binding domain-containing protein [unclassified Shewanella]MEC4726298.1 LysR family transcriptional regulator [Shewanella sp. D64]MEC4738310.1 LysR family transcriptional regulator [Shewanella sp. E94]WBJ95445.1 LysR family transcriptional regulator [Shewanella sp. MTB7]